MAIALTPFRAMCGFRELQEIRKLVLGISLELFALGDVSVVQEFVDNPSTGTFKPFFESIMKADAERVKVAIDNLLRECARGLSLNKLDGEEKKVAELALELNDQFPGDVGIFCAFFLQVIDLTPGEAIFLGAGEPHAYVSGGAHSHTHLILRCLTSIRSRTDDDRGGQTSSRLWPPRTTSSAQASHRSTATWTTCSRR